MYARPSNKTVRLLLEDATARNWTVTGGGSRHYKLFCPNPCECIHVVSSSTANQTSHIRARTRLSNHTCWESPVCPPDRPLTKRPSSSTWTA